MKETSHRLPCKHLRICTRFSYCERTVSSGCSQAGGGSCAWGWRSCAWGWRSWVLGVDQKTGCHEYLVAITFIYTHIHTTHTEKREKEREKTQSLSRSRSRKYRFLWRCPQALTLNYVSALATIVTLRSVLMTIKYFEHLLTLYYVHTCTPCVLSQHRHTYKDTHAHTQTHNCLLIWF